MFKPLLVIAIFFPMILRAQTNVLFVGNSFTHGHVDPVMTYNAAQVTDANGTGYGGIPGIFKKLTTQAGLSYNVTIEAVSGETLSYHLANKSAIIGNPAWNIVVLQENSTVPLPTAHGGDPAGFMEGADGLQDLILSNNPLATVLLYETWTSPNSASAQGYNGVLQAMQNDLTSAYYYIKYRSDRTTGKPDYSGVSRVGDAFMDAVNDGYAAPDPANIPAGEFDLWYSGDNRHPSIYGAYLSAATFFAKITGLDPRMLSTTTGSAASDLGIASTDAQHLLQVAYETTALADPAPVTTPPANAVTNTLNAGTNLNWNAAATWSAGALASTESVLINANSATVSQVANSLNGTSPYPASIHSVSFDIGTTTKTVQPNLTTQNPRTMTLTGGTDALGGSDLIHVSSGTTGTANIGTNSGFSTLTITLTTSGTIDVENSAGTLNLGTASILAGNVNVTKTGAGQLTIAGVNTFGAATGNVFTVSAGTVLTNTAVSGTDSATGASSVSVLSGSTLGGTGQITPGSGNQIVVNNGGIIAPGPGLSTLTINAANTAATTLVLMSGAQLSYELNSTGAGNFQSDKIALLNGVANAISFGGNTINFTDLSVGALAQGAYTLFSATAANNYKGLTLDGNGYVTAGLSIGTGLGAYSATLQVVGANLVVNVAPRASAVINTLNAGTNLNWNAAATWSAGALASTESVLINANSATVSQVANSLNGTSPYPASIHSVSFDIGSTTKTVQPNLTTQNPRTMTLTGGTDALGGSDLIHVSSGTTGTANIGTNSGFSTLTITLTTSGTIDVENVAGTLNFGTASVIAGNVNVAKTGAGQLVVAGVNTFGAATGNVFTVSAGTVLANTAVSGTNSATGAAGVSVLPGATLGGTGQITPGAGNQVVVAGGGTIAPGAGLGTLTINGANTTASALVLMSGAQLSYELNSTGAGNFQSDTIALLNGAANDISFGGNTINFTDLSVGALAQGAYTLFSAAAANNYSGLVVDDKGYITSGPTIGTGLEGYAATLQLVGGNIVANLTPTPYTAWKAQYFSLAERQNQSISGDTATPANDGIANLLKYALNLDPHLSATAGLPAVGVTPAGGQQDVTLTFHRVIAASDISYVVEVSSDLISWHSGASYTTVQSTAADSNGITQTVQVRALDPQQHFARLRITRN